MNLRDNPQFLGILSRAADRLGTESSLIEKDYWITQILRLISLAYPNRVIFKGGTSLSKGFSLIDRISEDIDLLIRTESVEDNDETTTLSRGASDRILKGIISECTDAFPMEPTVRSSETGRHRTVQLKYITADGLTDIVLLEMGTRGGNHPTVRRTLVNLVSQQLVVEGRDPLSYDDLEPVQFDLLHPGRTLIEKLLLLNNLSNPENPAEELRIRRLGRHVYDAFCLLDEPLVLELLQNRNEFTAIIASADETTAAYFGSSAPVPEGGLSALRAFDDGPLGRQLRLGLEITMRDLYLGDDPPTWDACIKRIKAYKELLDNKSHAT